MCWPRKKKKKKGKEEEKNEKFLYGIGAIIRIGWEIQYLQYAEFFCCTKSLRQKNTLFAELSHWDKGNDASLLHFFHSILLNVT